MRVRRERRRRNYKDCAEGWVGWEGRSWEFGAVGRRRVFVQKGDKIRELEGREGLETNGGEYGDM